MSETKPGIYNFDKDSPLINPLTGSLITSWYKYEQTWTGQFGGLATSLDECRAELVGAYLLDDSDMLELLGFSQTSDNWPQDIVYNLYQQLGVDELRGLANFNVDSKQWGQAHSRAHFAILKCVLTDGDGVVEVTHNSATKQLTVRVDRAKIVRSGKPVLGQMLLRLHMYRCTADVAACKGYYEDISKVEGESLDWRDTVLATKPPPLVFVQANTHIRDGKVGLSEYAPTPEGVIQSWGERQV